MKKIESYSGEEQLMIKRRLLIAKEFYLHGLQHSESIDSLSKIITIHNFHNAVEIVLKAIILTFNIRSEQQLNINFNQLINAVNNFPDFKDKNRSLPYLNDIVTLNKLRNFAQHQAIDPPGTAIDEYKVITKKFLEIVSQEYFRINFDTLNRSDFIADETIQKLIDIAIKNIGNEDYFDCIIPAKLAFICAIMSVEKYLPVNYLAKNFHARNIPAFNVSSGDSLEVRGTKRSFEIANLIQAFDTLYQTLYEKIEDVEYLSIILSTGINILEYKRFTSMSNTISFAIGGKAYANIPENEPTKQDLVWFTEFVLKIIINWQLAGIDFSIPNTLKNAVEKVIESGGSKFT